MPFYWKIMMGDDDIPNCIWWAVIALFVMYLLVSHQYYSYFSIKINGHQESVQEKEEVP
jgi:hypothetical protein